MGTNQGRVLSPSGIALALVVSLLPGCTVEQILVGQWYNINTPATGACPTLDWQFVVDAKRSINGYLLGDGQQRIASLSGVLNPDDSFRITATDLAGHQTADVIGQFTSQVTAFTIHGDAAGAACDGQTLKARLGAYFSRQGGGGGGGG